MLDIVCTVFRLSCPTTSSTCAGLRVYGVSALLPNHAIMCWTPCVRCFSSAAQQVTICWTPCVRSFGSPAQPSHHLLDSVCTVFPLCSPAQPPSCAGLRVYGVSALLLNHVIMCWTPCVRCFGSPAQPRHVLDSVCTVFRLSCSTTSSCAGLRVYGVSALLPNHVIMCWTPCVRCFGSPAQPSHRLLDSVCTVFRLSCPTKSSSAGLRVYGVSALLLNKSPSAGLRVYGVSALLLNHLMCWTPCVRCFGPAAQPRHHVLDSVCTVFRLSCPTKSPSSAGLRVYGVSALLPNQVTICWTPCVRCFGSPAQQVTICWTPCVRCFGSPASTTPSCAGLRVYGVSALLLNKSPSAGLRVYGVSALLLNHVICWTPCVRCFGSAAQPRHVLDSVCTVFRLSCSTSHRLLDSVCTVFRLSCPTKSPSAGLRVYGVSALLLNKSPSAGLRVYGVSALLPQPCHHVLDSVCTVFRLCCSTSHHVCWTPCVRCFGSPAQPRHHVLDSVCTVLRLSCPTKSSSAGLRVYGVSALLPNQVIVCWTPCVRCFGSPAQQVTICWTPCVRCFGSPAHRLPDSV